MAGAVSGKSKLFQAHGAEAAALYRSGLTLAEVGAHFGVSGDRIQYWLEKMGVERRTARDYDPSDVERFWSYVVKRGTDECWGWTSTTRDGYGRTHYEGALCNANRVSWVLENGPIPDGLFVLHSCDNRICTNPAHLFLGTNADNMRDASIKGRFGRKLTPESARQIRQAVADGEMQSVVAARYGVTHGAVWGVISGKTWKHA